MIDVTCFNWIKMVQKSKLGAYEKSVAHYLSTYMNQNQDVAWPSQSRMFTEMSIGKSTLNRALNQLEVKGWLVRERGSPTKNTRYLINVPSDAIELAIGGSPTQGLVPHRDEGSPTQGLGVVPQRDTNNNVITKNNNTCAFDDFWALYPRKVSKKPALEKFIKLTPEKQKLAIEALKKRPYKGRDAQYIPHPNKFISHELWEDEISTRGNGGEKRRRVY
jgi:DNA-binding transcriptional MocR family regulator